MYAGASYGSLCYATIATCVALQGPRPQRETWAQSMNEMKSVYKTLMFFIWSEASRKVNKSQFWVRTQ